MLLLRFFSFIYGLFSEFKNILFNYNILKSRKFNKTLICVGNLSTGGTGKTSFVDHLINILSKDYKIGIISRGYKRKSKGFHFVDDIDTNKYGDEVCMLKSKYPFLTIAVDVNRQRGIKKLIDKNVELIIMDDGFQNRWVKADIQFILTTFKNPFFNDYLLPFGRLREKKKNFKRSDYIIITKCDLSLDNKKRKDFSNNLCNKPTYFCQTKYLDLTHIRTKKNFNICSKTEILLVTAIADNTELFNYLAKISRKVHTYSKPDHYSFTKTDVDEIMKTFNEIDTTDKIIVTTEKDSVKLMNFIRFIGQYPFYVQKIALDFHENDNFEKNILEHVRETSKNKELS